MKTKIGLFFFCLFSLIAVGAAANELQPEKSSETARTEHVIVRPYSPELYDSTEQFEYEFEWQHGKIIANPQ
ncbi:hypothetical protein [Paenibacillus roseipurpureus]|uniref:Uncharacterized protein n=1 Tax=Paenibacillus roseopurpureus TaxID=2918901 RepID=A0AA96LN90_9BACL|nr:hypothetical protein [Paenibacillus sp. MBLB1832]WNR44865.1 hypothetical protein MJB10_01560 [Paenibacillus sp. MBLB1832]